MTGPADDLQLRPARAGDLDALLALEHASFLADRLSRRQYRRHLHNPGAALLVALDGAQLAGSILLLFRRGARVGRVYSLAVHAQWRGCGVGARLLAAGERAARARGCTRLRLEVRADNPAAQELYARYGYRRFADVPGYYADGVTAWRYEKSLAD